MLTTMGFKFAFVENILVRLLLIAALIYAIRFAKEGPLFALLVLLAIVTLLLERNHVVVAGLPNQKANAKIIGPTNLYVSKAPDSVPIKIDEVYADHEAHDAEVHLSDERVDIKEGPSNHDSPNFYKALGLV